MSPLKIAFGTTNLSKGGIDGIGYYCKELINQFRQMPSEISLRQYNFGPPYSQDSASLPKYSNYLMKSISCISNEYKIFNEVDLIHSTDQLIPIVKKKPLVVTVMDTIPISHPQFLKKQSRYLKPLIWQQLTKRADHIITISEFSKKEIHRLLNYPEKQITTIPLGVNQNYFSHISPDNVQNVLKKLGIKNPYFLFLGSIQPRKNLTSIIQAHALLPNHLATQFPLVIVGKLAWDDGSILSKIDQGVSEGRCIWLKYVEEYEKYCLLKAATGLIFTSLYEGFGLPIIEAFASGTPVITSTITSMPEVAGDCALFANPSSIEEISNAMLTLLESASLRTNLINSGLNWVKKFSWNNCAKQTLEVYEKLLT